ncbi:MAG: RNA polymerase-binding protein DksA [Gammaproteobacteria bacterium]
MSMERENTFQGFTPYQLNSNETYMNDSQCEHFRSILLNWKAELLQSVAATLEEIKQNQQYCPDEADMAANSILFNWEMVSRDRDRRLMKKIEESLERIKQGEYGYCEECGIEIGIPRLEARPTASKCFDCKTVEEIKDKHRECA